VDVICKQILVTKVDTTTATAGGSQGFTTTPVEF
jgi:hypothetical protein